MTAMTAPITVVAITPTADFIHSQITRTLMRARVALLATAVLSFVGMTSADADEERRDGGLRNVQHIIILMQENHSFDNYFGALPYAPGSPYRRGPCHKDDHDCVDGLTCTPDGAGNLTCDNSNVDNDGSLVFAFHDPNYCVKPDLDHGWTGSHMQANYAHPNRTLRASPNDGFVRVNDASEQIDVGGESPTEDETMGFYTQDDLPFYYSLAQTFAISDRYFAPVLGPTFPNRAYGLAATSFGHLTTQEEFPPPGGYKPINGTILDLLDQHQVFWVNYFSDLPSTGVFRPFLSEHTRPITQFFADAAAGQLPPVAFVDPAFGFGGVETDEHPPSDIRAGQFFVSQVVAALRNGPNWKDSILFITYDEHGGAYDHVRPPRARQGHARTPDGIFPGQCADATGPLPGTGANCTVSQSTAASLCPAFTPSGPYPSDCPAFDQYGFRLPFIAVSPFAKPHYVSHTIGDHASLLALIEKRFLTRDADEEPPHLTARDRHAHTLEDMFDFHGSPSLNAVITQAPPPSPTDPGCAR
jgi:phospholipase C